MANPTVTIEIKEIGARHVIGRLRAVQTAASDLSRAKRRLSRRVKSTGETFKKSGKDVGRFSALMQNLETNAVLALGPLSGVGARIRAIGVLARRGNIAMIAFSLGIAAVAAVAIALIAAMVKVRKTLEPVEGRLRAVTGSALLARLELERLQKISFRLGLGVEALTDGFSRLAAAARGTSLEGEGIRRVFDGVTLAAAALRLSVEDTEGILRAFEQALTKGVLRAEEFNQQLGDRLPGAAVLAAKAINKTKQQFQAMLVAGEIITEEFLPKLTEQFENLFSEEAERNVETLTGSLKKVGTAFSIFFDVLEARLGVVGKLVDFLNRFADELLELSERIDTPLAKARRSLKLFESDILAFELGGVLQTEKDRIVKAFTDLRSELQDEFSVIQLMFLRISDEIGIDPEKKGFIELSDLLGRLTEKKVAIDELTAALIKLDEFAIKPLAETTGPDISKITKAFEKFTRAAATESKKTGAIIAGSLFGAEFQASLLKAQDKLSKFSKNVVVEFAIANKVISEGLGKAFKEGTDIQRAQAFAEILGVVSDKFAIVIQNAKDFKSLGKIFESTRTPLEKFNIEMAELVRLQKKFGESEALSRAMENLKADLLESNEVFKLLQGTLDSVSDSFVDILKSGDSAFRIIGELVQSLLEDVLKLIIQLEVINPILNSISGRTPPSEGGAGLAVGFLDKIKDFFVSTQTVAKSDTAFAETAFSKVSAMGVETAAFAKAVFATSDVAFMKVGTLVTGDSGGGGGGILGSLLGGLLSGGGGGGRAATAGTSIPGGIGGFSHGGATPTNKPFVVGENGAEVLSFNRSGFVTPNNALGGTTIINQQFDFRGASLEAVALLKQEAAAIKRETLEAVDQKRRRGIDRART